MADISRFKINKDKKIGEGSFAAVYEAEDTTNNETVAAKVIKRKYAYSRELEVLTKIPLHQNIIQFIDNESSNDGHVIYMELCPMGNLDSYCLITPICDTTKFDIMIQIARGLNHVHCLDPPVVHRDLKPQNILVKSVKDRIVPVITDFGGGNVAEKFTTYVGTFEYMAPEMQRVKRHLNNEDVEVTYDVKVDVFSVALLFYDFLDVYKRGLEPLMGKIILQVLILPHIVMIVVFTYLSSS